MLKAIPTICSVTRSEDQVAGESLEQFHSACVKLQSKQKVENFIKGRSVVSESHKEAL
jgi:hypothetical protein